MQTITDQEIIDEIRAGGKRKEQIAFIMLDLWKGLSITLKNKYKLTEEQAHDAYADAIVNLITQIDQGSFLGQSKLSTYFFSILNNKCVDVLRKATSNKNQASLEIHEWTAIEEDSFELISKKDLLGNIKNVILSMGENCQNILLDWGFYGYKMDEIAKRYGLSSAETVRTLKYRCLKKLKKLLGK